MGFLDMFKRNDIEERSSDLFANASLSIASFFGADSKVSEEEAMKLPAVSSAIELITSSVAQLPIYLYKINDKGEVERIEDNRVFLLNNEPNNVMNGHNFKKQLTKDYLLYGASYTKMEKARNTTISLHLLPMKELSITKYRHSAYQYTAKIDVLYNVGRSKEKEQFDPEELIIVLKDSKDGLSGEGILAQNSDTLKLALDESDYTRGILKNGALPIGVLKAGSRLTEGAINRLRASWENLYSGAKRAGKTIILEEGLDYQPISMKPNDLDLTNIRKNTISEIARMFNIPESMINSSLTKYSTNEQNNLQFLQYCLSPVLTSIEAGLDKSLLLESEKEQGYYFAFDTSEIIRATEKEKIEAVTTAMKEGLFSLNEARSKVDLPANDKDYFTWSLGSVFYDPKTKLMTIPNMGTVIDTENPVESIKEMQASKEPQPQPTQSKDIEEDDKESEDESDE